MLYLEDYLEMIEHLPQELRDRFTEMREMDLQVHNAMDNLDEQVKQFFSNAKLMKTEQRDLEYDKIRQEYYKTLEDAEEKVHLANQIYELVDKYLRRLDQELQKFKIELEADNSGITEILERRSLELDNPPPTVVNHVREKRKYTFHNTNNNVNANNTSPYAPPLSDRPLVSTTEKALSTIAQEAYRGTIANPNANAGTGVITSSNITSNRLNSNAFTPLLAVVNANSGYANGNNSINSSLSPLIPSHPSISTTEKSSAANSAILPHSSFRCNLGNNAIAAAASQAIAATQQV
jgi:inhibitor of growth protein 3